MPVAIARPSRPFWFESGTTSATVLVAAHPDDEVIGAGGQLLRFGSAFQLIHVTDGAPRDMHDAVAAGFGSRHAYAGARREELHAALAHAGCPPERCTELGIADREASFVLPALSQRLADLLRSRAVQAVLTHAYEGGHPDHDATAFAVRAAARLLERDGSRAPAVVELTSYHAGGTGIRTGAFLPGGPPAVRISLSRRERALKRRMLACFSTQQRVLADFTVAHERFRRAPEYDFGAPPHGGRLFYEHFDWGLQGQRWRELARDALTVLGLDEAVACR